MVLASFFHSPVLLPEVIESLKVLSRGRYIDVTLGGGGHSFAILERGGRVLGIDADEEAIKKVTENIGKSKFSFNKDISLFWGNFANLKSIAKELGFEAVNGILFDLGMSSYQLDRGERGFSFQSDEPLDMRMDKRQELTAAEIINHYSYQELYETFTKFAEELNSRPISEAIVRARSIKGKIKTSRELAEIIKGVLSKIYMGKKDFERMEKKTLARIFQALRIEVNAELENLRRGLKESIDLLKPGGRLVVISYHSLEDRIVKLTLKEASQKGYLKIIDGVIRANFPEINQNPRARSAKLRTAEKI